MANVIFDFDGTIADSFALNVDIFCKMTGRPQTHTQADIDRWRQLPTKQVLSELHVSIWQIPILVSKWRKAMTQRMGEVRPFPGIGPVLQELQKQGHELSIVSTNSPQNIELFLKNYDLRKHFVDIYGDIGFFGKRRILKRILRQDKVESDLCYYVGDETRDVKAGNKVGMRSVAVAWGYTGEGPLRDARPFAFAQSPKDLPTILLQ